jgi:branched-chain amino acid transport system ATP-binding protein
VLQIENLAVAYDRQQVLWDVSFSVEEGQLVTLLGPNGAGKTTTLKTAQGLLKPLAGDVRFMGENVHHKQAHQIVAGGLSLVPEDRLLFPGMTVLENLELGAFPPEPRRQLIESLDWVFNLYPQLRDRRKQKCGTLSGGEQQMVAIGRALMARPKLLMLDEPSLGLAPVIVDELFQTIREINRLGITILLVEQNVHLSLKLADKAVVMDTGRVSLSGSSEELREHKKVREAYLGI